MAEETVVKEALTDKMIEYGAALLRTLDGSDFEIDAALWLYLEDANQWRLLLATPQVRAEGPRKAYKRLIHALKASAGKISPEDITLFDSGDPFVQVLRRTVTTKSAPGVRFSRNRIGDRFIEDAYIYRTAA